MTDGEIQASKLMTEAPRLHGEAPVAVKLRGLQTLAEIARAQWKVLQVLPKKSRKENINYLA
jgi:hypothetical protein